MTPEEYERILYTGKKTYQAGSQNTGESEIEILQKQGYKKGWQDGAEFAYNKANEWHYVKDGDLPKEKGNYLVAWKRTHHVEEYGEWGFDVDWFNADEGYFEGVGDYVIAWKEIVLPELPKEVDK